MKKEKTVKTHTRKTKSGKTVTVKQHTAKYDAAEQAKEIVKKAGAGAELERVKKAKMQEDPYKDFDFTAEEFAEWYEGTGSKADKKVEKALRKALGRKAYDELNDAAAEGYKKGGADRFFTKEVYSTKESKGKEQSSKESSEELPQGKSFPVKEVNGKLVITKESTRRRLYLPPQSMALKKALDNAEDAEDMDRIYWSYVKSHPDSDSDGTLRSMYEIEPLKSSKEKPSKEPKTKKVTEEFRRTEKIQQLKHYLKEMQEELRHSTDPMEKAAIRRSIAAQKQAIKDTEKGMSDEGVERRSIKVAEKMRVEDDYSFRHGGKRKTKTRKKKKNTPEEDAALDATLAEIRKRNKQPYQVSRRV